MSVNLYKIGAVERLTGVPVTTIRMWETRYQAIVPERNDAGTRHYCDDDVERIRLIKRLSGAGDALSALAALPTADLRERLSQLGDVAPQPVGPASMFIVGLNASEAWRYLSDEQREKTGLVLVGNAESLDSESAIPETANLLVIEAPVLSAELANRISQLGRASAVSHIVVIYDFGTADVIQRLESRSVYLCRAPVTFPDIARMLGAQTAASHDAPTISMVPPTRFTPRELAMLRNTSAAIKCECPRHLSLLVSNLRAFEEYCEQCESDSDTDASMHHELHQRTASARAILEEGLQALVEHEGIELPPLETL